MSKCGACGKYCGDDDVFCLNCGTLLVEYENIKLESIDYSLEGEEFLEEVFKHFLTNSQSHAAIMNKFSQSINDYTIEMAEISKDSSLTYQKRVLKLSDKFFELSEVFDNTLDLLKIPTFNMMAFSDIIWQYAVSFGDLKTDFEKSFDEVINSFTNLASSASQTRNTFSNINIEFPDETFDISKNNLLLRFNRFIIFHESFIKELKFIKDKYLNNKYMSIEDNHNHFCIYCGAKLDYGQNFCSECGKPVFKKEPEIKILPSEYDEKISQLEAEYNLKQGKAKELVEKLFDPTHLSYEKFTQSINKSNNLFSTQVDIARKMAEMDFDKNPFVEREIENKLKTLEAFIDKMEDLINELIIHMSSNKEDDMDINNLFKDMDDLIDSVKDY